MNLSKFHETQEYIKLASQLFKTKMNKTEILEKLNKHKPENLYDAGKISGITPSALFQIVKHKKVKGTKVA